MKILVMLAGWAGNDSEDTRLWLNWYREILLTEFSDSEVFLAISCKSDASLERNLGDLPNISRSERVSSELHVNSDASQYQLCLRMLLQKDEEYDLVFFMHTKGISYPFESYQPWRDSVRKTIFSRSSVESVAAGNSRFLIAERGHMIQARSSIEHFRGLSLECGFNTPAFHYAAATTLFYVDAISLKTALAALPLRYLNKNLLSVGQNRFFFEGHFPSLLTMAGAEPLFIGGSEYQENFNRDVSYDALPKHNSAIVREQYRRMLDSDGRYVQMPVPYVTGSLENAYQAGVSFEL
ncbi:hypothetical protein [Agrobacterium rosae]|uniref:Uncharacterized protein n=1 Tax=Agrobacterium rosae TaxID=1972867 RepID=A0AAW9FN40_9HYPH|nr:hypothetical protein [Agrobacterium rosae]MDX8305828.1 hypothetical protein [Agrobacterium rosae]